MGVKFGTEEWTIVGTEEGTFVPLLRAKVPSSVPNFTPIGATCRPCGAKKLKIGL